MNHIEEPDAPEVSLHKLVERVKLGETDQFRPIVLHFQRRLYMYCLHMLGNAAEAEDAVQDIFFLAYSRLDRYVRDEWLILT